MSDLDKLFEAAKAVREKAYAPYSNFLVGAAFRTPDGTIFTGCNVENASYPVSVCAEGGAASAMIAAGYREIEEAGRDWRCGPMHPVRYVPSAVCRVRN